MRFLTILAFIICFNTGAHATVVVNATGSDATHFEFTYDTNDFTRIEDFMFVSLTISGPRLEAHTFAGLAEVYNNMNWWFGPTGELVFVNGDLFADRLTPTPSTSIFGGGDGLSYGGQDSLGVRYGGDATRFDINASYIDGRVPEPSAIALMGLGLLGFVATRRRKSQA